MLDSRVVRLLKYLHKNPNEYGVKVGSDSEEVIILFRHFEIAIHRIDRFQVAPVSSSKFRATLDINGVKMAIIRKTDLVLIQGLFERCLDVLTVEREQHDEAVLYNINYALDELSE